MTKEFYMDNYKPDHTRYGGRIYESDFETDYRGKDNLDGSEIAKRIVSDMRFDEQCRKNIEHKHKHGRVSYSWNRKGE